MPDLRQQLEDILQNRACVVGVGNGDWGDDAVGLRLAEQLANSEFGSAVPVVLAGTTPERHLDQLSNGRYRAVLFVDALEFGSAPGSVVLLDSTQMAARFPQVSTHKISLGTLAQMIEANASARVWLLGIQPQTLRPGQALSPSVEVSFRSLVELLCAIPRNWRTTGVIA